MDNPPHRSRLDPEALFRMPAEQRAIQRNRMIEESTPELRDMHIEMGALWDSLIVALDAKLSFQRDLDQRLRAGMDGDALQSKEAALVAASDKVNLVTSKIHDLEFRIEQEMRELVLARFPPENRGEAERLIAERDEAIKGIHPSELERKAGSVAGAQLRLMGQIYSRPTNVHDPKRLAELELELEVLKAKVTEVDEAIADRLERIEAVRADHDARLQGLTVPDGD